MNTAFRVTRLQFRPREIASSLLHSNYRLYFFGQIVSVAGTWMQTVAQSFLVLDLTHSGTQLGLTTAARFAPMLIFGPAGGLFADRMDKRRVLYVTQTLSGLLAGAFAISIATHAINLPLVYILAVALGFVNVFDNPARQSFISEMVPADHLRNAVTLNSVAMNMARVFGGAAGGTIAAALGLALCFTANAISFGAVLISLALMRKAELFPAKRVSRKRHQVRNGLHYVRSTPELLIPLLMLAVVGTLAWEFQVTLPLMASKVFHRGAAAYGLMASVAGVGAVVGGLISTARSRTGARTLCLAAIGWGVAILAAAAAPNMTVELIALLFVGYGSITFNSFAKTSLQLAAKPTMRGRVMALWALAWLGSTPIGGPIVGWIGQEAGARWSLVVGGVATLACGILALPALTKIDRRREKEKDFYHNGTGAPPTPMHAAEAPALTEDLSAEPARENQATFPMHAANGTAPRGRLPAHTARKNQPAPLAALPHTDTRRQRDRPGRAPTGRYRRGNQPAPNGSGTPHTDARRRGPTLTGGLPADTARRNQTTLPIHAANGTAPRGRLPADTTRQNSPPPNTSSTPPHRYTPPTGPPRPSAYRPIPPGKPARP